MNYIVALRNQPVFSQIQAPVVDLWMNLLLICPWTHHDMPLTSVWISLCSSHLAPGQQDHQDRARDLSEAE